MFPFNHIPSRYVSLLASGDEKDEVREEGKKGVAPNQDNPDKSKVYPSFPSMVEYIYTRVSGYQSPALNSCPNTFIRLKL